MPRSGAGRFSVSKALFNYTHWTLIWTILFVYSIQVSAFSVLFGQFFKRRMQNTLKIFSQIFSTHPCLLALLAKLIGFVLWVITFIDFYTDLTPGVRYILCMFPNTSLMFCLQVVLQYERKGGTTLSLLSPSLTHLLLHPPSVDDDLRAPLLQPLSLSAVHRRLPACDARLFGDLPALGHLCRETQPG